MPAKRPTQPINHPPESTTQPPLTLGQLFLKTTALSLLFALLMLLVTVLGIGLWGYGQFRKFLATAELTQPAFVAELRTGWQNQPLTDAGHKNLLVLGVDATTERGEIPPLTDTMMMMSIDFDQGVVNTLPLPRDLWNEAYQTKINALYAYGQERYPDRPEQFAEETIEEMTGTTIHHTLVLSLEQLKQLIELVGGVEITVEQGFTDSQYPRSSVDITSETNPEVLYETITFEAGLQTLSGERALQYIRSRHSEDEQGHDLARGARQQQVIEALLTKLTNAKLLVLQPELAGLLYRFYEQHFSRALPVTELIATGKALLPHRQDFAFASYQLTAVDDDPNQGVLDNPARLSQYQYQWVYVITEQEEFESVVQAKLFAAPAASGDLTP